MQRRNKPMRQHFTEDQANAILQRAVERLPMKNEMSRGQLESVATELGVTPEALRKAEEEWEAEEIEKTERAAFIAERRHRFLRHLAIFGVIVPLTLLFAKTVGFDHDFEEMVSVFLPLWFMGLAIHGISVLRTGGVVFDTKFAKWRIRRRAREFAAEEFLRLSRQK